MEVSKLRGILVALAGLVLLTNCSTPDHGKVAQALQSQESVTLIGGTLTLRECSLFKKNNNTEKLLFRFDTSSECFFIETLGQGHIVKTTYGQVVPLGISVNDIGQCQTHVFSVVLQEDGIALSRRFFSRYQCRDSKWPEKPFHVLASDVVSLPAETITFELAY